MICSCGLVYSANLHFIKCFCGNLIEQEIIDLKTNPIISPWTPLHEYPAKHEHNWIVQNVTDWYWTEWVPLIPCGFCTQHWFGWVEKNPLEQAVLTPTSFFVWGWEGHNWVSENQSHKPTITLPEALKLWWPSSVNTTLKMVVK